jgi:hypothetical protein
MLFRARCTRPSRAGRHEENYSRNLRIEKYGWLDKGPKLVSARKRKNTALSSRSFHEQLRGRSRTTRALRCAGRPDADQFARKLLDGHFDVDREGQLHVAHRAAGFAAASACAVTPSTRPRHSPGGRSAARVTAWKPHMTGRFTRPAYHVPLMGQGQPHPRSPRRRPHGAAACLRPLLGGMPGVEVVAEAADGATAVTLEENLTPDVAIMDLNMPGPLSGIEAARRIGSPPGPGVRRC